MWGEENCSPPLFLSGPKVSTTIYDSPLKKTIYGNEKVRKL